MKYVIGVDFGGGACKATLLSEKGKAVATACSEYKTVCIGSGGREQDPADWYASSVKNIRALLQSSSVRPEDIVCIAFDAATHTAVLLDENFEVVRRSVYWTDTRCQPQAERLEKERGGEIFSRCKHRVDTIWTFPELLWIKENEPKLWGKVKKVMFAKDYVRHLFTGDYLTDRIEAQGSMLYDFNAGDWIDGYLSVLGLNRTNMPGLASPADTAGRVCARAARDSGLKEGTKVIVGTTDTAAEVFAAGAVRKGQATVKLATAGRICVVSDSLFPDEHIINYSHVKSGLFYPGTATKSCAASLRWFRDTFGGDYAGMDAAAEKIGVGCDGLLFHPYLSGELTPYGDPKLRGSFTGISGTHTKAHFARAVMEGAALSLSDCKQYLESKGVRIDSAFIIGGGAKSALWRSIVSDTLGIELATTENNDSSFGSAMLAGIAGGFFTDCDDAVQKCCSVIGTTRPDAERTARYAQVFEKYIAIQRALKKVYDA